MKVSKEFKIKISRNYCRYCIKNWDIVCWCLYYFEEEKNYYLRGSSVNWSLILLKAYDLKLEWSSYLFGTNDINRYVLVSTYAYLCLLEKKNLSIHSKMIVTCYKEMKISFIGYNFL